MNNHAGSTLTRATGTTFSHIKARKSCLRGKVVLGTRDHITEAYDMLCTSKQFSDLFVAVAVAVALLYNFLRLIQIIFLSTLTG